MFIIIDTFDKFFPCIVTNEEGMPLLFNTKEEAAKEAENVQNPIIVEY